MSDVNFKTRLLEHMAGTIYCQSKTSSILDGVTDFTSDDQGALNTYPQERTSEYLRDTTDATMIGTHSVFNRNAYFPPNNSSTIRNPHVEVKEYPKYQSNGQLVNSTNTTNTCVPVGKPSTL